MFFIKFLVLLKRKLFRFFLKFRVRNKPSIISRDCCGGVFYHDCMQRFLSPTIGLYFSNEDFVLFCSHLSAYLSTKITPKKDSNAKYPIGILSNEYGEVEVRFLHYDSFDDAVAKWEYRSKRVDFDNLYIILNAGPDAPESLIKNFGAIECSNKVLLTSHADTNKYPYCFNMKCFEQGYSGPIVRHKSKISATRHMYDFNFVKFVNK